MTLTPYDRAMLGEVLAEAIVGSPATVRDQLHSLLDRTKADEIMIASQIYDQAARHRSFEIVAAQMAGR